MPPKALKEKKLWKSLCPPYQIGVNDFTTSDKALEEDIEGWVSTAYCRPVSYDLVAVKTDHEETKKGWWNGNRWDGLRLKEEVKILYWKPTKEAEY